VNSSIACTFNTYQCNAPLPQVRAKVWIYIPENYNFSPTGKVLVIQAPYTPKNLSAAIPRVSGDRRGFA